MKANFAWTYGLLILLLAGCVKSPSFVVENLVVERSSWDVLEVRATFLNYPDIGPEKRIVPDIVVFTIFDASYDTLYVGDGGSLEIFDRDLGDREQFLVEVCGFYLTQSACEQQVLTASPKRVIAEYEVEFLAEVPSFDKGKIYVATSLERQIFNSAEWEHIRSPSRKELFVQTYVENQPEAGVRIPISRSRSGFTLSRHTGYRDLRYYIQSSMMDSDSAVVMFDLYARTSEAPALIESRRIVLRNKTDQERMSEIRILAELTGEQVLRDVSSFFGTRRAYVFINEWSFEALDKGYHAQIELHWQDAFRGEWSDLSGELYVRADGTMGTFTFVRGSERAERKWFEQIEGSMLELEPLFSEFESENQSQPEQEPPKRRR